MVTGKLLGDGNILIEKNKSPRFRFGHARKDRVWCLTSYQHLIEYIQLSPPKFRRTIDKRLVAGFSDQYYVQSTVDDLYVLLKEVWYPYGVKKVPFDLVQRVLSPLCLAWWYQDDGSLKLKKNTPEKVVISTESFSTHEISFLKDLIKKRYCINFSIDSQKRLVLYDKPSILYFLSIIRPYIVINRKDIHQSTFDHSTLPLKHRTSLYISSKINFNKPTKDIKMLILSAYNNLHDKLDMEDVYRFYSNNLLEKDKETNSYQIELDKDELSLLALFQNRTGFTKGEAVEYWYHKLVHS